jgi:hypothetical protein
MSESPPSWLCYEELDKSIRVDADDRAIDNYGGQCNCKDSHGGKCKDNSCINWATLTECVQCDNDTCHNQRIQRGLIKSLEVKEVDGKGFGLFSLEETIPKGSFIREYVGELVSKDELERR